MWTYEFLFLSMVYLIILVLILSQIQPGEAFSSILVTYSNKIRTLLLHFGIMRCFRFVLCLPYHSPGIRHSSKYLWEIFCLFVFVVAVVIVLHVLRKLRSQNLEIILSICFFPSFNILITSRRMSCSNLEIPCKELFLLSYINLN